MISESTYRQLPTGKFITRELDMIVVKGRTEPVRIYELMGFGSDSKPDEKEKIDAYAKALALYRNRQFAEAAGIFTTIGDVPSLKFVERCRELERAGVPEDWDGVYRFETK
jgi:adenylate cyclase